MKVNKTRKQKKGVQTIPQLRKAFDHIEEVAKQGVSISEFQSEWKKTFHHPLDDKAALAFLTFHKKSKGQGRGRTKKMKGGSAPLAGAPIDYTTRPGTYETPYGSFLDYIGSGFTFYDKINTNSIVPTQCGKENITPQLSATMGSNQAGGSALQRRKQKGGFPSLSELATAISFRPITATVPTNPAYDFQSAWKGLPTPASPSPTEGTPPYQSYPPTVSPYPAYPINRTLGDELR